MLTVPFYHSLLKKYVIIFGTLFNNINIERLDDNGNVAQTFKVPISYGPRDKTLARLELNPTGIPKQSILLPRMSFEMSGITYAAERKLQTTRTIFTANTVDGTNVYKKAYTPVPYDIQFTLSIMAKTTEDATRILEQILPYFTPEWTVSARLLPDFENLTDIPLVIDSVNIEDTYDDSFENRRAIIYTLVFTMKGYLYGPISQSKIIKIVDINYSTPIDMDLSVNEVNSIQLQEIKPGLDANGNPTTLEANTIPVAQIDETDNYGIIETKTLYPNGY